MPNTEKPIISPCVSVCALNDEDICTGCYRTGSEISQWGTLDNTVRKAVIQQCRERERKHNPFMD